MLRVETDQQFKEIFCTWMQNLHGICFNPDDVIAIANTDYFPKTEDTPEKVVILAVAIFNMWGISSCDITVGSNGEQRQKNSKELMWTVFNYAFNTRNLTCIRAHVAPDNEKSLIFTEKMGFKKVGLVPDFYGENKDALLYTFTKQDWQKSLNMISTKDIIH